ncbi:MAG: glycosyltransferase [Lachnospiraceae bacterium]|jgi:GT2 family glycosyltransferase|nr:glycosyltransferase [Lachnospiraceae bacterium]
MKIDFVKYNRTRKEQFQTKTMIVSDDHGRVVIKSALCPEAQGHIRSFFSNYGKLREAFPQITWLAPEEADDYAAVCFPYVAGETLSQYLGGQIADGVVPYEAIREALGWVHPSGDEGGVTNLDALFDNFILGSGTTRGVKAAQPSGDVSRMAGKDPQTAHAIRGYRAADGASHTPTPTLIGIDYEWVFDVPMAPGFAHYRTLHYFYVQFAPVMDVDEAGFLGHFGIDMDTLGMYEGLERRFQDYVHGENQKYLLENYFVETKPVAELAGIEEKLAESKERQEQLVAVNRELDETLRKVQEVKRLTDNHVTNLEIMIGDLRREAGETGKLLAYLNRHQSFGSKVIRRLRMVYRHLYPPGSVKRKMLRYRLEALRHPIRTRRLYATPEGRNLKEGDFLIGDDYRKYGKLVFPVFARPRVSIIIPVFNQVSYTYACLQSILEFTGDVPYEVLLADDCSTDGTARIGEFTENLVVCPTATNQGFLRNCNHAAGHASGEYLMFLNNDTKVTAGWLSALVSLMDADPTVGMCGSKLVYPDGRLQEAGGIIFSDGSGWNYGRLDDPDKPEYNYLKEVDYISGAAIMIRRSLWQEIGGFDERFAPAYCEDSDLAFAVRKAGKRVVYQPLSTVIHFEGVSNGTDVGGTGLKRYQVENTEKLREKWAGEFAKQVPNHGNPNPFKARERSQGKKVVLFIDHYVPTYDRDAGSRTTFAYLKLFLAHGYCVKFIGDNFLREEPYTTTLQQMGVEVFYGQGCQAGIWAWLREHGREIDFAYLNRPHIAAKYIDFIRENTDIKMIYYGHDLHFLREVREYGLSGDEGKLQASRYWKSIELSIMRKVAMSYYPSFVEVEAIKEIDETIPVKDIVAYIFEDGDGVGGERGWGSREGLLFVGGFSHPPNADGVLWFAREVYPLIRSGFHAACKTTAAVRHPSAGEGKGFDGTQDAVRETDPTVASPDIPLYIVGSHATEEIMALEQPGNGIVVKGFVPDEELSRLYATCRVVVVPLRYGAGVKGKVIEALHYGAAVVTTSVGAEGIRDCETVMEIIAMENGDATAKAFAQTVRTLYNDERRLAKMGAAAKTLVAKWFSPEAAWEVIRGDFE